MRWRSLHKIICEAKGCAIVRSTCDTVRWARSASVVRVLSIVLLHSITICTGRATRTGSAWDSESTTLDWLGVVIHVSSWREGRPSDAVLRELLGIGEEDAGRGVDPAPVRGNNSTEEICLIDMSPEPQHETEPRGAAASMSHARRVNAWLLHRDRLRPGRHRLPDLLTEIDRIDAAGEHDERRICVSMCCSAQVVFSAQRALWESKIRRRVQLEHSGAFVSDIHVPEVLSRLEFFT